MARRFVESVPVPHPQVYRQGSSNGGPSFGTRITVRRIAWPPPGPCAIPQPCDADRSPAYPVERAILAARTRPPRCRNRLVEEIRHGGLGVSIAAGDHECAAEDAVDGVMGGSIRSVNDVKED